MLIRSNSHCLDFHLCVCACLCWLILLRFVDFWNIKCYLCKKRIISENVFFEPKFMNFFISWKSHVLFLRYSNLYTLNHSVNFKGYDVIRVEVKYQTWSFFRKYLKLRHPSLYITFSVCLSFRPSHTISQEPYIIWS